MKTINLQENDMSMVIYDTCLCSIHPTVHVCTNSIHIILDPIISDKKIGTTRDIDDVHLMK